MTDSLNSINRDDDHREDGSSCEDDDRDKQLEIQGKNKENAADYTPLQKQHID